jgi:hypothetical protein
LSAKGLLIEALERRQLLSVNAWKSAIGGDWDTPGNWSLNHVPNSTEDVQITVAGSYTVTHAIGNADSIKSLTSSATISLGAGSISVAGAVSITGKSVSLTGGTLAKGTIATTGGQFLVSGGNLDGTTINGTVTVQSGASLNLYHNTTLGSTGKVEAQDSTIRLYDLADGAANLLGSGQVLLDGNNGGNFTVFQGAGSIASGVTIHGYGQVTFYGGGNGGTMSADQNGKTLSIVAGGVWTNKGKLQAINGGTLSASGTWTSPGTISENNSTLNLGGSFSLGSLPTRTGGTINITGAYDLKGGTLALNAATGSWNLVNGALLHGTLTLAGGANLAVSGSSDFDTIVIASNFTIPAAQRLNLSHNCVLNAGLTLTANDSTVFLYQFDSTPSTLSGSGQVVLGGSSGGSFGMWVSSTIGSAITVRGFGTFLIYGGTNTGTIVADQAGKTLGVYPGGGWTNKGKLQAINGSILAIGGGGIFVSPGSINEVNSTINFTGTFSKIPIPTRTGGNININGIYDLTGGALALNATTGSWNLVNGTIANGTLTLSGGANLVDSGSSTFDKLTLASNYTIPAGQRLNFSGACTINAGVTVTANDSTAFLYSTGPAATINGGGVISLGGTSGGECGFFGNCTLGAGMTIQGYGNLLFYSGAVNGTVNANVSGRTLLIQSVATNQGIFRASKGAILEIQSSTQFVNNGAIDAAGGTVKIDGNFANTAKGQFQIGVGGTGPGTTYGVFNDTGTLTFAGTLCAYLFNGYKPAAGTTFTPLKYIAKAGTFATNALNVGANLAFTPAFGTASTTFKTAAATSVANLSNGLLTMNGTSANDTMTITNSLGLVIATRNGVSSVFSSALVTGASVNGGDGADKITISAAFPTTLLGGNGNDSIYGGSGNDSIDGGAGNDLLYGNNGNDLITGGTGADSMSGGAGNDSFHAADGSIDSLDGGSGTDIILDKDASDLLTNFP